MNNLQAIEKIIQSRPSSMDNASKHKGDIAAEGGCGVIGIACNEKIAGKHLLQSLIQMRNRGNGKGGGIAAVGLDARQLGVTQDILENDYLLAIAYLEPDIRPEVEETFIHPVFEIDQTNRIAHIDDYQQLAGLEIKPPVVYRYFVRIKDQVFNQFVAENHLENMTRRTIEDEIVYQNSFRLNKKYYASTGTTRAFVLSHGKNMIVLKMVGYGDDVIRTYKLEDFLAHVWIGHHRYPTKGKVWHPGGAHPFVGLNEALVHNGDFANYASITEYLAQRKIHPLFLTDTEVSALVFDLLHRTYQYPLEYVIEALAPTTERDFSLLSPDKQAVYEQIQRTHIHSSPDGPWFFLIGQSAPGEKKPEAYRLIGITDTSMLRPQVFAIQESGKGDLSIGFAASEKQAIDAALESLSKEDSRFWTTADKYWNARGGSHTDGGAFIFSVIPQPGGSHRFKCTDKFGHPVRIDGETTPYSKTIRFQPGGRALPDLPAAELFAWFREQIPAWHYDNLMEHISSLLRFENAAQFERAMHVLTLLIDRRYPSGQMRRSSLLSIFNAAITGLVSGLKTNQLSQVIFFDTFEETVPKANPGQTVVIDCRGFAQDGNNSLALFIRKLYEHGFRRFKLVRTRGHRFIANGFGKDSAGTVLDIYGSSGDYLASGLDGAEVYVHGNGQDQLAQIMKSGKLVVYGDVGQTFGYAAKGGSIFVLGNAAGRPLINAVGKPKVIINGTCLDYLAESFMAGDPLNGGGFVVLNGIEILPDGEIRELARPYPGGNLFSLASGGAIYIRDPHHLVGVDQLNGGEFAELSEQDWALISPCLEENANLFSIPLESLLDGKHPKDVYRKIHPRRNRSVHAEEAWVRGKS